MFRRFRLCTEFEFDGIYFGENCLSWIWKVVYMAQALDALNDTVIFER
jgi:hypothetical protein